MIASISERIAAQVAALEGDLCTFLQEFVRRPSLPAEEEAAQGYLAGKLTDLNLDVEMQRLSRELVRRHPAFNDDGFPIEKRMNVIGRWRGTRTGTGNGHGSLILNGHVDVVPTGDPKLWSDSPWSGAIRDGRLYGRGACDMKGGLAAAVFAIDALRRIGFCPAHDVLIESVVGEESGGVGTLATIIGGYTADAALILEPTSLAVCPVQSGALTFRIITTGRASHASMKPMGVSAFEKFGPIFHAIEALEKRRHAAFRHPLYEDPSHVAPISLGTFHGGDWHSTVPDRLVVEGRYGVMPGETLEAARNDFEQAVHEAAQKDEWLREHPPTIEWFEGQFESGQTDVKAGIVEAVSDAHLRVVGSRPRMRGVTYGSDLRLFTNHALIPTVLCGPGDVAITHCIDEYVEIREVLTMTRIAAETIAAWCGGEVNE